MERNNEKSILFTITFSLLSLVDSTVCCYTSDLIVTVEDLAELRKNWQRTEKELRKSWERTEKELRKSWQRTENWVQHSDNFLVQLFGRQCFTSLTLSLKHCPRKLILLYQQRVSFFKFGSLIDVEPRQNITKLIKLITSGH